MMADHQFDDDNDDGDDIFVYTGGDQEVPIDVRRVRISRLVDIILARAFLGCDQLIEVEGHDGILKIGFNAFNNCISLRRLANMTGVREVEWEGFRNCSSLRELEFVKLEIIGPGAFAECESLVSINMPSIRRFGPGAFTRCYGLTYAEFGEDLERIVYSIIYDCTALRHITIPLKHELIVDGNAFNGCDNLSRVEFLVGGNHKTISSLHMKSWRDEIIDDINRINLALPELPARKHYLEIPDANDKSGAIEEWIRSVLHKIDLYKHEHCKLLKEVTVLLELVLWKANLDENDDIAREGVRVTRGQRKRARKERYITSGASIIIKNVLPFLELE